MSVTESPVGVRLRSAWVRVAVSGDVIAVGALVILSVALAAVAWGTWGDLDSDTGYDVEAGARVADGELAYRDFTYFYGPLAPLVAGLSTWIGGGGVASVVAVGLLVTAGILAATYGLARTHVGPLGAFLAAAITAAVAFAPTNYSYVLPHTMAATFGTLLLLLLLLGCWAYLRYARLAFLVAAGAAAGLATLTKPEPALAAVAALGLWLLLGARTGAPWRRELVAVVAPLLVVPVAVYGVFLTQVSPGELVFDNLYPVDFLDDAGGRLLDARMPHDVDGLLGVVRHTVPYALGVAALLLLAAALERPRWRAPVALACAAGAALVLVGAAVKPDGLRDGFYYFYGWVPVGAVVALVVVLRRFRRRAGSWSSQAQMDVLGAAVLAVLAATTFGEYVVHGWSNSMAAYYMPFAAILVARLHLVELGRTRPALVLGTVWVAFLAAGGLGLTLKDVRAESVTVSGPGGSLAETEANGRLYQAALAEIAARTTTGEPVLVAPLLTGLSSLSGHPNGLSQLAVLPGSLAGDHREREAIAELQRSDVRLAVIDNREFPGYGHTSFGDSYDRQLAAWITDTFDRVVSLHKEGDPSRTISVWIKRRDS
jgi:hypothetical protein